ncbi:MAG: YkgJ family cysteine cluster protein [Saprospiraceae bacterium]|nr:YkgJ family cysteine cluster protein [Saprospiraceae bacterium]
MQNILQNLSARAREEHAANKKYFQKLAQKKPKHLDETVLDLHEEVFSEIDCLTCANCCKTTSPIFRDKDIERIAQHLGMRPAAFVDKYLHLDEDGDYVHNGAPCPFLGADNYCSVYEARPKACREYPHTDRKQIYQIAQLTLKNTEICPAAFEIVKRLRTTLPL